MRALVLHNEKAGFGSDAVFMFIRALAHPGDEVQLRVLPDPWDPDEAVADVNAWDLVVVSGGDGTVGSLLWALRGSETPVCVFPSGTANLFVSDLGNAPEPAAMARACRVGATMWSDIGQVSWQDPDGQTHVDGFTLMSGTGFDATLMRAAVPNKKAMGQAAYLVAAFDNPNPPVVTFDLDMDGEHVQRDAIACIIANTAMIQGEIEIVPDCRVDDGLLDVILLEAPDAVGLLRTLAAGIVDRHGENLGRPQVERFQCREVKVRASQPVPMQIDGDALPYEVTHFEAAVLPSANRLIVDPLSPYFRDTQEAPKYPGTEVTAFPPSE